MTLSEKALASRVLFPGMSDVWCLGNFSLIFFILIENAGSKVIRRVAETMSQSLRNVNGGGLS